MSFPHITCELEATRRTSRFSGFRSRKQMKCLCRVRVRVRVRARARVRV